MRFEKGQLVSKEDFLKQGAYAKEQYEGMIVGSDIEAGCYNIGIQLSENKVLVVDKAMESNVRERIQNWVPKIQEMQRRYDVVNDLGNYVD